LHKTRKKGEQKFFSGNALPFFRLYRRMKRAAYKTDALIITDEGDL
jgi:hypothetical protein